MKRNSFTDYSHTFFGMAIQRFFRFFNFNSNIITDSQICISKSIKSTTEGQINKKKSAPVKKKTLKIPGKSIENTKRISFKI